MIGDDRGRETQTFQVLITLEDHLRVLLESYQQIEEVEHLEEAARKLLTQALIGWHLSQRRHRLSQPDA